jgi:hypothetical protein
MATKIEEAIATFGQQFLEVSDASPICRSYD